MRKIILMSLAAVFLIGCSPQLTMSSATVNEAIPVANQEQDSTAETVSSAGLDQATAAPPAEIAPTEPPPSPTAAPTDEPVPSPVPPTAEPPPSPTPQPTAVPLPGTELFTFAAGEPGWFTVDDDVMGGVSDSFAAISQDGILTFAGSMSLDNNGGFSSVRSNWSPVDLTGTDGLLLRVRGDGNTYRVRIRTAAAGRDVSYNGFFATAPESWQLVYVPYADMVPTYRGFIMDVGPIDPATIGSFGIMLSDKQEGEFALEVDWIRAVAAADLASLEG